MKTVFYNGRINAVRECNDLFEFLQSVLCCSYISDLRTEPYCTEARRVLKSLDLSIFNPRQVNDVYMYIGVSL